MIDFLKKDYNKNIKYLFLVFGIALINSASAQNVEELHITAQPYTSLMKINNDTIKLTKENQPKVINLKHGTYPIELWAPGFETVLDTIHIAGNKLNKYSNLLLLKTEKFKEYEKLNKIYNKAVVSKKTKKGILIVANALLSYYIIDGGDRLRINKQRKKADAAYQSYIRAVTFDDFEMAYSRYTNAQEKHNNTIKFAKTKLVIGIPVLIGAYIGTWFQFKKINKKPLPENPIFQPNPPFSKPSLNLGIDTFEGGYGLGLTLTF